MSNPDGRPRKMTDEQIHEVVVAFENFIEATDDPNVPKFVSSSEVAIRYRITKDDVYNWDEFDEPMKRSLAKQEARLLEQEKTPVMAIFRLKQRQFGYSDKIDVTSGGEKMGNSAPVDVATALAFTEYLKANTKSDVTDDK